MKKIENTRTLGDVILAILSLVNQKTITNDPGFWHPMFAKLSSVCAIPQIRELNFDFSPITPWSDELYQSFFFLEMSNLLGYYFPTSHYSISARKRWQQDAFKKFSIDDQIEIRVAASLIKSNHRLYLEDRDEFKNRIKIEEENKTGKSFSLNKKTKH